jgi:alpha-glucosidase
MSEAEYPWWKRTTIYQIYPRSFADGNADGTGDLEGIISRLDYLGDTGFETIWISPFFSSPQEDFGYDISGYRSIAPEYGDMDTCLRLIEEVHRREMKIVFDLVLNHTSRKHPWFIESRSSKDNPKRDWYIWKEGRGIKGKRPPNNWRSLAGSGPGWHYDGQTDQWYWASFLSFQPDLNFRNPEVKNEMLDVVRFWLDRGVDGFRLDIFASIYKEEHFTDNPFTFKLLPDPENDGGFFRTTEMVVHRPEVFALAGELRALTAEYGKPERFLVGEVFGSLETLRAYCGGDSADGLHLVFLFQSLNARLTAGSMSDLIRRYEHSFAPPLLPTWVFSNHDRRRRISVLDNDIKKAKLNAALQLSGRGVPVVYYGEEIGMPQTEIDPKDNLDPVGRQFASFPRLFRRLIQRYSGGAAGRDGCRTPMQWDESCNGGFCPEGVKPWLPVHPSYRERNVEIERHDPDSLYSCYRRFLRLRNAVPELNRGAVRLEAWPGIPDNVLVYTRYLIGEAGGEVTVILNFANRRSGLALPEVSESGQGAVGRPELLVSTRAERNTGPIQTGEITLEPYEGIVIRF